MYRVRERRTLKLSVIKITGRYLRMRAPSKQPLLSEKLQIKQLGVGLSLVFKVKTME